MKNTSAEILVAMENKKLLGAAILYLEKNNEVTIFVEEKRRGFGTALLTAAENFAKKNKLQHIWAWVLEDNIPACSLFLQNNFLKKETSERVYNGRKVKGILFENVIYTK